MSEFPAWLRTEEQISELFSLLGFEVESSSIEGRQIDLIAKRETALSFAPETWIIEVTTEKVDYKKGSLDSQKLLLAKKLKHPRAQMMIVSTCGFTKDQQATLEELGIHALLYSELEQQLLNLRKYALNAIQELQRSSAPDIGYNPSCFVDPRVELRFGTESKKLPGEDWIRSVLDSPAPTVCALLGNLGSGKTTLVKRLLERGCSEFLADADRRPVPVYVPLGRFKQHSGDISQMLMAEFRRSGQDSYPSSLVQYLIREKRIILILDGLDEIYPLQNSDDVLTTVTRILASIGQNAKAVLTCRKHFFESTEEELAYFGDFTSNRLRALQENLTRTLRGHPSTSIAVVMPFDDSQIYRYFELRCSISETDAIGFLEQFYGFHDMAQTPVLLSMMAATLEGGLLDETRDEIPLLALYKSYTGRWIERDIGSARLSPVQRRELSEVLAEHLLWSGHESEEWNYLLEVLRRQPAWKDNPLGDDEAEIDIRRSGFLIRDLDDRFHFVHRSIMEFFAAQTEVRALVEGKKPRGLPTDGCRLFVAALLAAEWLQQGKVPIPPASWVARQVGRMADLQHAKMFLLADSSRHIPEGNRAEFGHPREILTEGSMRWSRVVFTGLSWQHHEGELRFQRCQFVSTKLTLVEIECARWEKCGFEQTTIDFRKQPKWVKPQRVLGGGRGRLSVPGAFWDLAELVTRGAEVTISGQRWNIDLEQLTLCAEVYGRLQHIRSKRKFLQGNYRGSIKEVYGELVRRGWIDQYSRRGRMVVALSPWAKTMFGELPKNPLGIQERLDVFRV